MRWQLRLRAAERGVFKAVEMHRLLAQAGLPVSAGKMSALWSTTVTPVSIRLDDLDIICRVLGCDAAGLPVQDLPPRTPPLLLAADTVGETWPWNDSWPLQRPHPPLHATRLSPVHPPPRPHPPGRSRRRQDLSTPATHGSSCAAWAAPACVPAAGCGPAQGRVLMRVHDDESRCGSGGAVVAEGSTVDLIRLADGESGLEVRVLGRTMPGVLTLHDYLDAEIVVTSGFAQ